MPNWEAEYSIVQFVEPGKLPQNIAIMLYVPDENRLYSQFREEWTEFAEDSIEMLRALADDFATKAHEMGGEGFLRYLEDSLSNSLRITERSKITIASCPEDPEEDFPELDQLFRTYVYP